MAITRKYHGPPAFWLLAGGLFVVTACELFTGPDAVCTAEPRWALRITVVSAADGSWITAEHMLAGTLTDGAYVEELTPEGGNLLLAGQERPGLYTITVTAAGFETWTRTDVRVRSDRCGPIEEQLTAEMIPGV